jgi:putative FmdB family regulatory protein
VPIYEYRATDPAQGCEQCREGFEVLRGLSQPPLVACPACGASVTKQISAPSVGLSKSGLDHRAKNAGFHKLERLGKGEYEKKY